MLRVKFQGGEPTLRSDFRELCAVAKSAGIRTATISHGAKIATQPELLDYLDELVISLDSVRPEVNDSLRGLGSYRSAIQAIDISQKRGIKTFINMAVCQTNFTDVEAVLEFCEARGILMNAQPIVFGRRYYDDKAKPVGLSEEQIRALHLQLADWKKQGRNLLFSPQAYLKVLSWPGLPELSVPSEKESACPAGKDFIHIDPNGDISPCIQHAADFRPKNILVDGLVESLRHARTHNCEDCWPAYLNERKALFRLKPHALREMIRRS
jgi:MoaA/NifB/PqqE/SkfB family radical SAM enzyme